MDRAIQFMTSLSSTGPSFTHCSATRHVDLLIARHNEGVRWTRHRGDGDGKVKEPLTRGAPELLPTRSSWRSIQGIAKRFPGRLRGVSASARAYAHPRFTPPCSMHSQHACLARRETLRAAETLRALNYFFQIVAPAAARTDDIESVSERSRNGARVWRNRR